MRLEVKGKKFPCFCYKCHTCRDILKVQGDLFAGPQSCSWIAGPISRIQNGNPARGLQIFKRIFKSRPIYKISTLVKIPPDWVMPCSIIAYIWWENPKKYQPGTWLVVPGIKKVRDRADFFWHFCVVEVLIAVELTHLWIRVRVRQLFIPEITLHKSFDEL